MFISSFSLIDVSRSLVGNGVQTSLIAVIAGVSTLVMSDVQDRQRALREDGGPAAVVRHHQSEERTDGGALCNGDLH